MSTSIVIQARTGSTRLPNKMLMPFFENKGILQILLERIKSAFPADFDEIVVATTVNAGDDRIVELCNRINIKCHRGSEADVLSRFIEAALKYKVDKVIRVCADNVFLDTELLTRLYYKFEKSKKDYVSYCTSDGIPSIKTHYGFWAEGVSLQSLERVCALTSENLYHEHVTNYIYSHPTMFSVELQPICETIENIERYTNLRLTIDTIDDFKISQEIYSWLKLNKQSITSANILNYLKERPGYFAKMKTIINQNSK